MVRVRSRGPVLACTRLLVTPGVRIVVIAGP